MNRRKTEEKIENILINATKPLETVVRMLYNSIIMMKGCVAYGDESLLF